MKKEAYNKFKYYLNSCPDFKESNESSLVYFCTHPNGMAGVELVLFDEEKKLRDFKNSKKKILDEGKIRFQIQMHHNETQLSIYRDYLNNWSLLYDLIQKDQRTNKTDYHWEYRDYNFLWRCLIVSARNEVAKYKDLNQDWYNLYFNSLESYQKNDLVMNEMANVLLIENTLDYIESEINETDFYEKEINIDNSQKAVDGLKIAALEKINQIFNYKHPIINKHVSWKRGIRIHYIPDKKRYKINVQILHKNKTRNSTSQIPRTPEEAFKKSYINDSENTQYHFVKLGQIKYPLMEKYIFPFYKTHNSHLYIARIIEEFKDEFNYNQVFENEKLEKYFQRISYFQKKLPSTKTYLESILKPFNPSKFDSNFLKYLNTLIVSGKLNSKPWCRYEHHDHELIHCVELQYEYVEKLIELFHNLQEYRTVESIKLFYSKFDQLFKIDSSLIIELMENLGIIKDDKYILNRKKFGSVRGVLDACLNQKLMIENNLTDNFKVISGHINLGTDKLPDTSDLSEKYRKDSIVFINANIKTNFLNN